MKKIFALSFVLLTLSGCIEAAYDTASFFKSFGQKESWKALALDGDAEAQYKVGDLYCCGERPRYDNVKALYWYCRAAKQGQRDGLYMVGKMYDDAPSYKGNIIPKDDVMAYAYYSLAAENGNEDAIKPISDLEVLLKPEQLQEAAQMIEQWPDIKCEVIR